MPNANHYFTTGKTHHVCEDYADSESHPTSAYAFLGDGCSLCLDENNKPIKTQTDFGSRLLVRAGIELLRRNSPFEMNESLILEKAYQWAISMGISKNSLSSTLLMARGTEDRFTLLRTGDGIWAAKKKDSSIWTIWDFEFSGGRPYYLRYRLSMKDQAKFLEEPQTIKITRYTIDTENPEDFTLPSIDQVGCSPVTYVDFLYHSYDMVAIFSDGVKTFCQRDSQTGVPIQLPLERAILPFLSFKNFKGEFVYRRCRKAIEEFASKGIHHLDDFSMVAVVS